MLSFTEENYLKALVQLTVFSEHKSEIGVNKLAESLSVKPATVTDMVRKLKDKGFVNYEKYGKVSLTAEGKFAGMMVIRRHRLWETFLHSKLDFSWDEVHELAEDLEHIHSIKLINRLEEFLGFPDFDPHGDAIPNREGEILIPFRRTLAECELNKSFKVIAVKDNSADFLRYVDRIGLKMGDEVTISHLEPFDQLMTIEFGNKTAVVSPQLTENVFVICTACKKARCTC